MDLALYHPEFGYYARAARRSGRAGDFFTSVDVGPLFGELLASPDRRDGGASSSLDPPIRHSISSKPAPATAGWPPTSSRAIGRSGTPICFSACGSSLVEASPAARAAQGETLRGIFDRPFASSERAPGRHRGRLFANELLDALPVHQVVMRDDGLKEVYVEAGRVEGGPLRSASTSIREGPLSTPALAEYLERLRRGARTRLADGDQPAAPSTWIRDVAQTAAARLRHPDRLRPRGARAVLGVACRRHADDLHAPHEWHGRAATSPSRRGSSSPAIRTSRRTSTSRASARAAEAEGLTTIGFLDQTYFVLGLLGARVGRRARWRFRASGWR